MGRPPSATLEQHDPVLADQLVDQSLRSISRGSDKKVEWRCAVDPRHIWWASPMNRTNAKNPTGCGVCSGKVVIPGVNDVATTHPDAAALLVDRDLATTLTSFSNKVVELWCGDPVHKHWKAPLARTTSQGSGCPQCSGRNAVPGLDDLGTTHPDLADQLVDQSLRTKLKAGSGSAEWTCSNPLHPNWMATVEHRSKYGHGCPACSGRSVLKGVNDLATTHPQVAAQLVDPDDAIRYSAGYDKNLEWRCVTDETHPTWMAPPYNRTKIGSGCPVCTSRKVLVGYNDIAETAPELAGKLFDPADANRFTAGTSSKLRWRCDVDPNHEWWATPSRFLSPRPPGCSECFRHRRSGPETELLKVLRLLMPGERILTSDRKILGDGRELDVVAPDRKVAIEFNGTWWHCEANVAATDYHQTKSRLAAAAGYRLVHVWEDDWFERNEIVVRGLAHRLGATTNLLAALPGLDPKTAQRVYARSLSVQEVDGKVARRFWQNNHAQGPVGSKVYLGLVDADGEVRALLGAGPTNHGSRSKPEPGVWDVQRYATKGSVPGGFTRLLKNATAMLRADGEQIDRWTSYSNDDVSDGGMYEAAGFTVDHHQDPAYSYVGTRTGWTRSHRSNWTRGKFEKDDELLYEAGWTEHQAALANGLYRVYDAGKTRWVKQV